QGWNVYYRGSVIALDFSHNPPRTIRTPKASFCIPQERHSYIHSDISADSVEYEAESWSLTVEHKFCKKQDKRAVKRQDVIYELMQTELHHLQTLHIMAEIFRRGMRQEVQLDTEAVERVFPCLDQLLLFHHAFFAAMKEQRHSSTQPQGHRNYLIQRIGDILIQQFTDENGEKMKQVYGEFCSRHNEAVSFFKELQQHNKRFQTFIRQQGNNSLVRRREIPECILLVTQRITKYPVLLERILHYTQEETEEHADLSKALAHIREVIAAVDMRVSEYERHQRLQEVFNRMENRSAAKLKSGHTFRKQDMMGPGQVLKHQGVLLWKTATGRLKDVLALLLTDTLIFLQEKDQKYTFATVDQKPPVIPLQKLIVREVANEERGMFLISASAAGPEMYEVHTSSKEERNTWMRLIREAVERCAAVTIQDSCYEVQRLLLQESGRPSPRAQRLHLPSVWGSALQDQEKQRNLEKQKEEAAVAQRLHDRLRQEKERWERECQARKSQQGAQESMLEEREKQCQVAAERLRRERVELDEQLEEYQQNLERLREGQRSVERERERLDEQQKLLQCWKHGPQDSPPTANPHMFIPLDGQQVLGETEVIALSFTSESMSHRSRGHTGNGSVFVNEAALASTSVNNRHVHHRRNDASTHNCLNSLLAQSNGRQPSGAKTPHGQHSDSQGWMMGTGYLYSPAGRHGKNYHKVQFQS
uniref:Rho guanine nucleotide exchange factor (GEF) 28a n=1 Tax=Neolamprologus brichardi TaxID=32507 RepID=A0A3Q4GQZ4_NEOBR